MKIGVLQTDAVLEELQGEFGDYPAMFEALLRKAAIDALQIDLDVAHYDVVHGEYPARMDECDGYVITGSKKSVYDDEPWIHRFQEYVKELHNERCKLVGICFGHQMIAQALGGDTSPAAAGWGVGLHRSDIVQSKSYMQPQLSTLSILVSHQDQVQQLPPGAEVLSSSEFCPISMFQVGEHILAVQGHPEFNKDYSRALMNLRRDTLGEDVYGAGIASLEVETQGAEFAQWIVRFIAD